MTLFTILLMVHKKTTGSWKTKPGKSLLSYRMNYFFNQVQISVALVRTYLVSHMRILRTALFILFSFPCFANAQSHCGASEIDYFSCKTSAKDKIVSICGNIGDEGITGASWLQYRFGQPGKIELIYPKNKVDSIKKFEGNYFVKYDTVSIRFINENALFDLTVSTTHEVEGDKIAEGGGITVTLNKNRYVNIPCKKADVDQYFSRLTSLATELGERNGQTDFLYQFLNPPPK